jgi:ATP-dependent RNA helicase RhlE
MKFSDLGLAAPILQVLEREGYTSPTPIQGQAIPPVLAGSDVMAIAQTGTGKTAAFALPILTRLAADKTPVQRRTCRALVLSPTRELAAQIGESFRTYGQGLGLSVATVFGGVSHGPQRNALLRGVDIVVATPGRLLDHVNERNLDLSGTSILVLDEADQMLDLGFVVPIRRICAQLASRRQSLFFSATMPREIAALAAELLRDPVRIAVAPVATTAERVDQQIIHVETAKKRTLLVELLADEGMSRTLIFTRTKRGADKVTQHLVTAGIDAAAIHGNKSQRQREQTLDGFRKGKTRVLVATDIAARGIDIDSVTHVINYELPEVPEAYVHRIGRTARAGNSGRAISLVDNEELDLLKGIERLTRISIPSTNRRNDPNLAAAPKMPGSSGRDEGSRFRDPRSAPRGGGRDGGGRDGGGREGGVRHFERNSRPGPGSRDGGRDERPRSEARDRPARPAGDRPAWSPTDKPVERSDRPARPAGDRPDRSERPARSFGDRPDRGDRSDRPAGPRSDFRDRPARPAGDRPDRGDRPARSFGDRPDRGDRPARPAGDRPDRDDRPARPAGDRPRDAGPRSEFRDRPARPAGDRPDRGDRPARPAGDRPARPAGDRPAGPRSDFRSGPRKPAGEGRGERPFAARSGAPRSGAPRSDAGGGAKRRFRND